MTEGEDENANRVREAAATPRERPSPDEDGERKPRFRSFYTLFATGAIRSFRIYKKDGYIITVYDP
jgi:hypothetical protein